jgi:hypothetical protein
MKKLAIFLICFFPAALLFLVFTFRFKPDGGFYFTFLAHAPVIIAGDGSSYQSAYQLRHGRASDLKTTEIETIRDRYWVGPGRSYEDFNDKCYGTLHSANTNLNGRAYDIITFTLSNETKSVYFNGYKSKTQP